MTLSILDLFHLPVSIWIPSNPAKGSLFAIFSNDS